MGVGFPFENQNTIITAIAGMLGYRALGNYFVVTADFSSATWNTVGTHETHTVTGTVRCLILPEIKTTLTGATATIDFGTETAGTGLIIQAAVANLTANKFWTVATPLGAVRVNSLATNTGPLDVFVSGGLDLGYAVGTAAFTAGRIDFHTWWIPVDNSGNVVAGAGGAL